LSLFSKLAQNAHQVTANGAANTAIVHLNDLVAVLHQQFVVDADFAEFVFDHSNPLAVRLAQDAIEERGFAAPKEACNNRNGDLGHQITLLSVLRIRTQYCDRLQQGGNLIVV
jgi:hypothetical protein